ncbi:MAG TPA: ATP-dependent RecD-like DNA helicase [Rhabdochlamydiaceae bacterium]|jgi:exodeoxyribonuclease V alpha subunit
MEEIYGFIESIVFAGAENGFTVARLKEPKKKELTTLVGSMPSIQPGETIRCKGMWKHHPEHGYQFEVKAFELEAPSDLLGIKKYLESGMIKGIGPVYAERIVNLFGLETLDIIDATPERLSEVPGIGGKRMEQIQKCWKEQNSIRNVMVFLRGHGASPAFAQKIYKTYGDASIEKVRANPFQLAKEIHGIGFKTADAIAKGIGIPHDSAARIDAGIEFTLWELSNEGHVCYPEGELAPQVSAILEVAEERVKERIAALVKNGDIIQENDKIWVKPLFFAEIGIARELARLKQAPCRIRAVILDKAIEWVENKLHIALAPEQKDAVRWGMQEKVLIITGGPGTGKSTITKALLAITEKITGRILLAAPTGKAAKRINEITHRKAFTIHCLLEMDFTAGTFKRNKNNPLSCDLLIVDEASMIDTQLMYHLLKAIPADARVIFIGDVDQLPSVGPGIVLKDLISSEQLPVIRLKKIFRQAAGSRIITNAHKINEGIFPDLSERKGSDFQFIEVDEPEEIVKRIVDLIKIELPKGHRFHRFDDIQVLSPMKRGVIGTENLNVVLQQQLNPSAQPLHRMGRCFHMGDKIMQIRNNYEKEVFNGDVGKIVEIDLSENLLKAAFDGKVISYDFTEMDELILAYAVSIHKFQGSECLCVIIPIHTSHFKMLYRNLLYTGLTRGKKRVIFIGTKQAIAIGIRNEEVLKRHTGLRTSICKTIDCYQETTLFRS